MLRGKWIVLILVTGLSSCGKHRKNSSNSSIIHWQDGSQIALQFNSSVPVSFQNSVKDGAIKHNDVMRQTSFYFKGSSFASNSNTFNSATVSGDGINGIYFSDSAIEATDSAEHPDAITYTSSINGIIVECDVVFRKSSILSALDQDATLEILALHELGHALGLGHSSNPKNFMFEQVTPSLLNLPFTDEYYSEMRKRYELKI